MRTFGFAVALAFTLPAAAVAAGLLFGVAHFFAQYIYSVLYIVMVG